MISLANLTDIDLLTKSWGKVRSGKPLSVLKISKGIDKVTLADFLANKEEKLKIIYNDLKNGNFKATPVKVTIIEKDNIKSVLSLPGDHGSTVDNNKKYRIISVPAVKDRVVQRALLELIYPSITKAISNGVSYCGAKAENAMIEITKFFLVIFIFFRYLILIGLNSKRGPLGRPITTFP